MQLDQSTEHLTWDNVEAVHLEIDRGASLDQRSRLSTVDYVPVAKRRALSRREQTPAAGGYTAGSLVWHIPAAVLTPGVRPKIGDAVMDLDQERWTVVEASLKRNRQRWELTTLNLRITHDLRDTIDVQRAARSSDAAGVPAKTFPPDGGTVLYRALPCRVQLVSAEIADQRGIRGTQRTYTVIVDRQISVDTEDRILWRGQVLDITGYRNPELISELPVIDALAKV
jgi:hypothetical protein